MTSRSGTGTGTTRPYRDPQRCLITMPLEGEAWLHPAGMETAPETALGRARAAWLGSCR